MEANSILKVGNVNDLVYSIISPNIFEFGSRTECKAGWLKRVKEVTSIDKKAGGKKEFVVVDCKKVYLLLLLKVRRVCLEKY